MEGMDTGEKANTPVKVKVSRMEAMTNIKNVLPTSRTPAKRKRGTGGKGRQPSPQNSSKQAKLTAFFGKKSPKAQKTRARLQEAKHEGKVEVEDNYKLQSLQGALSPLLGDLDGLKDHPSEDTWAKTPSRALVGVSEVRGRSPRDSKPDQKRVLKTLESWVQGPSKKTERPTMKARSLKKRALEDNQQRKEALKDIRHWFETKGLGV